MGKRRDEHEILVGKLELKKSLRRSTFNVKINVEK
jgi:hypothetical protein